jgi:putative two-component system response regulator
VLDARLVIVDDQPANIELLHALLARQGYENVLSTTEPEQAVKMCTDDRPDLLLLDLHMPGMGGLEVLAHLSTVRSGAGHFPVLVLTADAAIETRHAALAAGADDFLVKPIDHLEVAIRVRNLVMTHRMQSQLRNEKVLLEDTVRERTAELELARGEVLDRLALATEFRDDETHEHARRIGRSAALTAAAMGVNGELGDAIERAALLHDIGKVAIPDAILLKPAALSPAEFEVMKTHTTAGARILASSQSALLRLAEEIALTHHERWSGDGYPSALAREGIPLAGRIVAVADVFDALTHARPYKPAWPVDRALEEIAGQRGRQFDPDVVDGFVTLDPEELLGPAPP